MKTTLSARLEPVSRTLPTRQLEGKAAGSSAPKQRSPHSLQALWPRCGSGGGVPALPGGPCTAGRCLSGRKHLIQVIALNPCSAKGLRGESARDSVWAAGLISKVQGACECPLWDCVIGPLQEK